MSALLSYCLLVLLLCCCVIPPSCGLTCTDGSSNKSVPDTYINDDYCDCIMDGEDETATSACAHVARRFVCVGDVMKKSIAFSFVKDNICDCCDGSDEDTKLCKNTCVAELDQKIKEVQAEVDMHLEGESIKKKYIKAGNKGVKQLDNALKSLRKEVKIEEVDFQDKMQSQNYEQRKLIQMYNDLMQKQSHLEAMEKLSARSSFGSKNEYFPLLNKCYQKVSNEKQFKGGSFEPVEKDFMFEICPFSKVVQVGLDTGARPTLLGNWQGWDTERDNEMIYSGGDECWNGPNRVVRVRMVCALEEALVDVKENGKCTYEFILSSPAACSKQHAEKLKKYISSIALEPTGIIHDEL